MAVSCEVLSLRPHMHSDSLETEARASVPVALLRPARCSFSLRGWSASKGLAGAAKEERMPCTPRCTTRVSVNQFAPIQRLRAPLAAR